MDAVPGSSYPEARQGLCLPLSLRFQGQCQFGQQEPSQEVLLPERPTQLEHAGHLGVWSLAGKGGALQRGEEKAWMAVDKGQGSEVKS